ncbi:unnamed protein product [Staurois parvus]|uniref:Uncharacterized protein n=1 Tax=Staurois parvus TaxID=386267 RepID=A0ABN9AH04_9NEOB|nr:unnamed protein product [Staurois parvus]
MLGLVCSSQSVVFIACSGRATIPSGSGSELPSIWSPSWSI